MTAEPSPSPLYASLEGHSASNGSQIVAFLWGLAEATLFFIIPDVYLGFVALFHWRKGLWTTVAATAGAMVGGAFMYLLGAANGPAVDQLLIRIPLIGAEMVVTVAEQLQSSGLLALIAGPLQGIPYKIYAAQAGQQNLGLIPLLLLTIPERWVRFFLIALAGAALGRVFKNAVQRRTRLVICAYALVWVAVYVGYYFEVH